MNETVPITDDEPHDARVLLVDDHHLFRTGLRNLLEGQGVHIVGEAASGSEALQIVRETAPDVVVMDLNMPGMTGVEATRLIRGQSETCRVPIVAMSAHCEGSWREEALAAGAADCFSKPIEFEILDEILGRYAA